MKITQSLIEVNRFNSLKLYIALNVLNLKFDSLSLPTELDKIDWLLDITIIPLSCDRFKNIW